MVEGIPGSGPAVERNAAYDVVLKDFPEIEVVARQAGDWSRASGQRVVENIITAHPDLNGIHFDGGEMALGGIQALRAAGFSDDDMRNGQPFLTGMDNYNGWLGAIEQGSWQFHHASPAADSRLGFGADAGSGAHGPGAAEAHLARASIRPR